MDELGHLTPEDDIFSTEDVLRDDCDPDRILERDDVLNRYLRCSRRSSVENDRVTCLCTAPPASEKTVGTHRPRSRLPMPWTSMAST